MDERKINVQLKKSTHEMLSAIGSKGDTFDEIIRTVLHQRNILMIHHLCGDEIYSDDNQLESKAREIFRVINFEVCPPFVDNGLNGNGDLVYPKFDGLLEWAFEMALDEDFVGSAVPSDDRELPLAEAITNVYCLMCNIPAPTWSMGGMLNPFVRFKK